MGDPVDRTEPRKLELLRRVVDRADRGEVFASDADVDAALRDPELDARRRPRLASEIDDPLPDPILSLDGRGAVLTAGSVTILAGEGGRGKSSLAYGLAVEVAAVPRDDDAGPVSVGPLTVHGGGGPILLVTYEDRPGLVAWALRSYASEVGRELGAVYVLDMAGRPVFGPLAEPGRPAMYNTRPVRLPGWADLAGAVEAIRPRIVVVDPALSAFVGEPNAVGPVREFVGALGELGPGVLLLCHSTKAVRREGADPFDAGHVGGSSAWVDGVRGVLVLGAGETDGLSQLACPKANYGPARLLCGLQPVTAEPAGEGRILGFRLAPGGAGWHRPDPGRAPEDFGRRRRRPAKVNEGYQHGEAVPTPTTV